MSVDRRAVSQHAPREPGSILAEEQRLGEDHRRERWWRQWGTYLSHRQWGTVREDYSADGSCWSSFPHDHARSRAYRWGEDGLLGLCDRHGLLCFSVGLWNGRDPILKERPFGLTNLEGNHGEDVKECYWFLEATPTASYAKALYRYPQQAFPYERLIEENRRRTRFDPEFELVHTGVFDEAKFFDVFVEYAKADPTDILIRLTIWNRGPEAAALHLLPMLWFRNTWSWGRESDGYWPRPRLVGQPDRSIIAEHAALGRYRLSLDPPADRMPTLLFTENESNTQRLWGIPNAQPYVKDAFNEAVVDRRTEAVNPAGVGTRAAMHLLAEIPAGDRLELRLRLAAEAEPAGQAPKSAAFGGEFGAVFERRIAECEAFHAARDPAGLVEGERRVVRQANAGLLWSRQFYHYVVPQWLEGDPAQVPPPAGRAAGRNRDWKHVFARDILSMPDTWEYPWFAAWDLAFQIVAMARIDPEFAKHQLVLFLREWYMHPAGQLPAYEFAFDDSNPPVHAWACWRVYKDTAEIGGPDRVFLERCFQKLLLNFTWWVNRRDPLGRNLFGGGFLGLDNIGLFDRSAPPLPGVTLMQADGTAWMASYCLVMLEIALELAKDSPAYEDVASKFFEHFVSITDAMNSFGGNGLWDEQDGFYYDAVDIDGSKHLLRSRSVVGLLPLTAVVVIPQSVVARLPGFRKRMLWFIRNRDDLCDVITWCREREDHDLLLALPSRSRLERVLRYLLDEKEFLSPFGIRSLSRVHLEHPVVVHARGRELRVDYVPGESTTGMFGGNSNWRGPVWFPVNHLLVDALLRYHTFYGDSFKVECPTGSGRLLTLAGVAEELARRLASLFTPGPDGWPPCTGEVGPWAKPDALRGHWQGLVHFHEYFHGDNGRGLGADHQTGWTALVAGMVGRVAEGRAGR